MGCMGRMDARNCMLALAWFDDSMNILPVRTDDDGEIFSSTLSTFLFCFALIFPLLPTWMTARVCKVYTCTDEGEKSRFAFFLTGTSGGNALVPVFLDSLELDIFIPLFYVAR